MGDGVLLAEVVEEGGQRRELPAHGRGRTPQRHLKFHSNFYKSGKHSDIVIFLVPRDVSDELIFG